MRFPGLKSRKSSSGAPSTSPSNTEGAALQPVSSNDRNGNTSSTSSSLLSRWKSNASGVDEHGVLRSSDTASHPAAPAAASTTTTANTGKRSFFSRKSHSRSLSYGALEVLQNNVDTSSHSGHATISTAAAAAATAAGGHPLRQHTLPADLDATPQKPKRPGLSFPKRGFTTADLSSSSHPEPDLPRKSAASSSYHAGSPTSYAFDSTDSTRPLSRTQDSPASRSSDSFQLKSFRSVTGVREEPTLSSLVDAELTSSPLSTRPSSPATAPVASSSTSSYFDSRSAGGSTASSSRTPTYSNASISVSRFREAKAARSISSLNSNASQSTAQRQHSGLKLDLPPPITLEYPSRPVLNIVQPDSRSPPPSRPATPINHSGTSEALSRASSASPSRESYSTAYHTLHASPPRISSPSSPLRSPSSSLNSYEDRQPAMHPLAVHPDNALPLPPVPVDPEQQQRQHRRTQSNQSISSLSASLGGWLNSTSTSFGLSFSAEDMQKTLAEKAAALRNRTPSVKDGLGLGLGGVSPNRSLSQQQPQPEEEVTLSPAQMGPTREELAILLGGKVLPPPPSETGDDYDPRAPPIRASPTMQSSPKMPLSRASSFSNFGFGSNLFASAFTKVAKPAKDDEEEESENSRDVSLVKATQSTRLVRVTGASNALNASDTSSDEAVSDDEEDDSDDSDTRVKKKEKSLVFPPPRPTNEADRQRIYQAALTPPTLTPEGSSLDLKAYIQPVPQSAPLTSANIESLNNDDDDEDVPLSTIKIRAQSEIEVASLQLRPSAISRGLQVPFGGSAIGVTNKSPFDDRRGRIREKHASSSSLAVPTATSTGMPRSLSAFSTTVSEMGATSHQMQSRSASSQALSTLPSATRLPRHVSLSSLIELEAKSATASLPEMQKKASTSSSRPSNSSYGNFPPTPSDSAFSANFQASPKPTLFTPTHLSPIRKHGSQQRGHRATSSDLNGLRQDDLSRADGRTKGSQHAKEDHRKSAALLNRNPPSGETGLDNSLPTQPGLAPSGWTLSPQALQGMPAPPGVDPNLYASLPPDQKLNLQMRAQQLLSLMQSMALQASSGTLGGPNSQPSQQFMSPSLLPMQMQMPMMGSAVPAFPPFPNFFGVPAGFPNSLPPMFNTMPTTQPYQTFASPSAIGQPTLFQQAGLSAPGATARFPGIRRDFQRQRRESQ